MHKPITIKGHSEGEIGYLAGLFDGEGCIEIRKANNPQECCCYSLTIRIGMNCKEIIYKLQYNFGGSANGPYGKNRKTYTWNCSGREAGNILRLILPYLIEKKEQTKLALEYLETFGSGKIGGPGNKRTELDKELQELYHIKMQMLKKGE